MFSRTTTARIAIGILLGVVLGVVLHESNTRQQPAALRGDLTTSTAYVNPCFDTNCVPSSGNTCYIPDGTSCTCQDGSSGECGAGSCVNCMASSAPEYYICACGGCVSSGFGTMGEWGTPMQDACPSNCGDSSQWPPECFPSSSSTPQYCCSGAGICEEVFLGLTTCIGAETSDSTCGGPCTTSSSAPQYCCSGAGICEEVFLGLTTCIGAETSDSTCGGPCTTSSEASNYCCNVQTGNCETVVPNCIGDGGDCSGGACCNGLYCDSNMLCVPGTPE